VIAVDGTDGLPVVTALEVRACVWEIALDATLGEPAVIAVLVRACVCVNVALDILGVPAVIAEAVNSYVKPPVSANGAEARGEKPSIYLFLYCI
jgi:hypothetical protein